MFIGPFGLLFLSGHAELRESRKMETHPIKSVALIGHLFDVRQVGANADNIGTTAMIGQSQFLAISGFKDDGYKCVFY